MISASMDSSPKKRVPHYGLVAMAMTRYWGEAVVVAIALLVWLPRLSGPIDLALGWWRLLSSGYFARRGSWLQDSERTRVS